MSGVRVGLLHSLSGAMAYRERPLLETELMTIAQINDQGGVLGQIIEPVIEDGASDCFTFEQKAQKLIQQDGVTTLFGCWTTASRHAVRPVLEAFNAQLWYPASYEGLENCSQIFYTGFCANQQVELTINWLLRNQKTRCYLLGWDQVFSYTLNKLMKVHLKHYGGEVVGEAYLPSSTMDFEAIITRIRQAQPDIIINTLRGDRNLSFYRQFYESGIKASDLPILATSLSESEVQKLQEAAVGHFSCFHYFQSLNTPENHQFVQVFKRFYGEERVINNSMATAHTQIHLWKQAVELAESFDVERVKIAAYGQCFVSPGGLVRLEPNHHVAKVCRIGQVLPNQEFEVLYTSEKLIKPLPWLGFNEDNFNASGIVFELLSEVSQGIERAEQLEQKSIELEATKAQLQQEIETRKQFELALQKANEQLEKKVAERTAALKESNDNLVQEIVQHQRSENALRMATDQLQTVLEAVPGTVSWIDSDLCYIEVNQRLANMLNLPRERFIGQHIGFLGTSSEFQDFVQDLFDSPEIDAYREVRNQVNGEWRHYLIVAQKYNYNRAAFVVGIDITERKQAEESLRNAKNQLQTVLEAVPGTVSWIDSDLCYIEVNQRLSNMLNLPRERFVGQHIGFLGTSSEFQDFVQDLFNSPEIDAYREVRNQVNGEWRHYLIVAQKYNDNQAAFVVGIDITERREAEAALRLSQDQLEAVLDVVPGTVSWISSDLRYLGVNRYLASTFDLQPEDFVNQDIGFLKASFEFNDFVRNFFDYPEKDSYQEVMSVIQGKPRNYLIVAHKYNQNQAAFFVGIDITERKQAEEALKQAEANYRSIFENAVEGIFQTTPTGIYLSANPALARIYGYQSPEELIQNITNIQDQLYVQPQRRQQFVKLLAEQGAIVGFESQIRRLDGQLTWISENAFAVRDEAGNLLHYEGTVEDINERKQAEAALQRAMEQLEIRVEERTAALREANHQLVREVAERTRIENALRESEAELRALFAAMTDVITVFDSEGRYKKIVTTNSEVLYSPTEELLGKTVFEVFPASHATLFYNQIQEVLNTKQTLNIEYSLVSAEYKPGHPGTNSSPLNPGDEVWFAAMVSPMPDNCVIWVARNTTERRRVLEALQAEREKSERLLLNILPPSIAEQLKQNQHSIAERFEQATIMFADIVDFTGFSARISPSELVNFLNQVFSAFDELAEKHHLEKIKTIGDSYMVAGGLPTPRHDHVEAMAEMALDMQAEIRRFQGQMGQSCNLRIGINTGPVVAGVIGTKKFIYDLWGDAVNIASRMESQGEVGKIQVTATTKNLLNGKYDFEERGLIDVKGRGEMLTYWLTKRRLV
ncbi:transporter substrate-binding protein [Planktothrix agardhii 1032]|uniref:transporter substrate-binding protein n=1 Tax=Planktothrix agardhii TaxID=1160 RepID=UPI001D0AF448|nr:transporter substrate-binding protein [Planktothrix agardhii]MCB8779194.1 transporter substrate-binding protein [Planktothrix agardhii 1031]MCF3597316.1 transporter substrate-binding protein [Planktothrix agardhii 1032]